MIVTVKMKGKRNDNVSSLSGQKNNTSLKNRNKVCGRNEWLAVQKSVSQIFSSVEKYLIILALWKWILQIDTGTIFALRVKIRCLIINCIFNGKKFQNVLCSFEISKDLFVHVSDIDKISTVLQLSLKFIRFKFNFGVGRSVVTCSYLYLFNL